MNWKSNLPWSTSAAEKREAKSENQSTSDSETAGGAGRARVSDAKESEKDDWGAFWRTTPKQFFGFLTGAEAKDSEESGEKEGEKKVEGKKEKKEQKDEKKKKKEEEGKKEKKKKKEEESDSSSIWSGKKYFKRFPLVEMTAAERDDYKFSAALCDDAYLENRQRGREGVVLSVESGLNSPIQYFILFQNRTLYVVFRGTDNIMDAFIDGLYYPLYYQSYSWNSREYSVMVHTGMYAVLNLEKDRIIKHLGEQVERLGSDVERILITGHSLGGGYATMLFLSIFFEHNDLFKEIRNKIGVHLFGSPNVLSFNYKDGAQALYSVIGDDVMERYISFVNNNDSVPRLLGSPISFNKLISFVSTASIRWPDKGVDYTDKESKKNFYRYRATKKELLEQALKNFQYFGRQFIIVGRRHPKVYEVPNSPERNKHFSTIGILDMRAPTDHMIWNYRDNIGRVEEQQ